MKFETLIETLCRPGLAALLPPPWSSLPAEFDLTLQRLAWLIHDLPPSNRGGQAGSEYGHPYRPPARVLVPQSLLCPVRLGIYLPEQGMHMGNQFRFRVQTLFQIWLRPGKIVPCAKNFAHDGVEFRIVRTLL
jgi:hypothetical protein